MDRKKLLIIAGAGATVPFGMPSTTTVGNWISDYSKEAFPFAHENGNLYDWMRDRISKHIEAYHPRPFDGINFENVLGTLYQLIGMFPAGIFTNGLGSLVTLSELPEMKIKDGSRKPDRNKLILISDWIIDFLVRRFFQECKLDRDVTALKKFIEEVRLQFDVSVITTNYDNVLFDLCSDMETGFNEAGEFVPRRLLLDTEFSSFLHLHGSVYFDLDFPRTISWNPSLERTPPKSIGRMSFQTPEGYIFPNSTIIAGYGKPYALQQVPFRTYYSRLDYLVEKADALLVLGFSFVDTHVRSAFTRFQQNRPRPVVSIDFACNNKLTVGSGDPLESSPSAIRITNMFGPNPSSMTAFGESIPYAVGKLKQENEFEKSKDPNRKLAIWYGGMRSACDHVNTVIQELQP